MSERLGFSGEGSEAQNNEWDMGEFGPFEQRNVATEESGSDEEDAENHDDDDAYDMGINWETWHDERERDEFSNEKMTLWSRAVPPEILQRYDFLTSLPEGIGVMGGVARSIAREMITGERESVRDIDLVNILNNDNESLLEPDALEDLAKKYMPDDFAFGHGIGSETLEHYFKTRDFTVNQCLILDGELVVSNFAYNDFQENIIRPTYYELPYSGENLSGRLFLKALMMRDVLLQETSSIPLLEDVSIDTDYIRNFDIAVFLNKTMGRGAEIATDFTEDLADWDLIPEALAGRPKALAKFLLESVYGFEFRESTDEYFLHDQNHINAKKGRFSIPRAMTTYHASNPTIRQALAEYDDDLLGTEERQHGRYTRADFDEINTVANPFPK